MSTETLLEKKPGQTPYPWLHTTWARFLQCTIQDRLPHAILLVGPQGIGLQALATAMGEYLICPLPFEGHACGQCKACRLLQAGSHPDLNAIVAEGTGKTIKIDQIRAMMEFTATTAQQGGRRVILITPAEAMNRNASNALLKGLEEPGENCIFILVSEAPAQLLPTIRSRCRRFDVPLPETEVAVQWLVRHGVDDAAHLLAEAGGRPLLVTHWIEHKLYGQRELVMDTIAKVVQTQLSETAAAKLLAGHDPVWVVDQMQSVLIKALKLKSDSDCPIPDDTLLRILAVQEPRMLCQLFDTTSQRKQWLLGSANPNVELLMAELLMAFRGDQGV